MGQDPPRVYSSNIDYGTKQNHHFFYFIVHLCRAAILPSMSTPPPPQAVVILSDRVWSVDDHLPPSFFQYRLAFQCWLLLFKSHTSLRHYEYCWQRQVRCVHTWWFLYTDIELPFPSSQLIWHQIEAPNVAYSYEQSLFHRCRGLSTRRSGGK